MWNIFKLSTEVLKNRDTCLNWLRSKNLFPSTEGRKCPRCRRNMTYRSDRGLGQFRCRNREPKSEVVIPAAKGTWFENIKTSPEKIILTYAFAMNFHYDQAIRETSIVDETSPNTVADWYNYCREVCMCALDDHYEDEGKIGGQGHTVEIDESLVGRRKYHRGRLRQGHWILGMIDREGGYRLEIIPENTRSRKVLTPLIKKLVAEGTTSITDGWAAYKKLGEEGYIHKSVNHSKGFKDPRTGAHTNTIEGSWKHFKYNLTLAGCHRKQLADHMCAYIWHRECKHKGLDPFEQLLRDISNIYPTPEFNL